MRVAGLDLALDCTGVATEDGVVSVKTRALPPDRNQDHDLRADRMSRIRADLVPLLRGHELVVLEGPAYSKALPSSFDRAGLWWDLYRGLRKGGFEVAVCPPPNLQRYATGKGNAGKTAVVAAITRLCPQYSVANDDEADALVLRLMGADKTGAPLARVPAAHRTALAGVSWPARLT